jgi:hypothetical protein
MWILCYGYWCFRNGYDHHSILAILVNVRKLESKYFCLLNA